MRSTTPCGVGTYGTRVSAASASVAINTSGNAPAPAACLITTQRASRHDMDCTAEFLDSPPRRCRGGGLYSESRKWRIIPDYPVLHAVSRHAFHLRRRRARAGVARLAHHDALLRRQPLYLDRHPVDYAAR